MVKLRGGEDKDTTGLWCGGCKGIVEFPNGWPNDPDHPVCWNCPVCGWEKPHTDVQGIGMRPGSGLRLVSAFLVPTEKT